MQHTKRTPARAEHGARLDQLNQMLKRCSSGNFSTVLVSGPLSSGKTTLLHAFSEYAVTFGAQVLSAYASHAEETFPFGVLEQVFQNCGACLPHIQEAIASWMDEQTGDPEASTERDRREQLARALGRTILQSLQDLADQQPVVIVIDDAHYSDQLSLQCLLHVMRRLKTARVLLVLAEGDHLAQLPRTFRTELLRHRNCQRVFTELLSPAEVFALLAAAFSPATAERLSEPFYQISGGNPLLMHGLIDDARTDPPPADGQFHPGAAYERAVLDLLYRSSYPLLENLTKAVAILDRSATVPLLGQLIGADLGSTAQAMAALRSAGVLEDSHFRHWAMRAAVLNSMCADEVAKLHSEAAHLLKDAGEGAALIAPHLVDPEETQPWGIAILRKAAEEALGEGELKTAICYLRRAHEACTDDRQRATLASLLISTEWRSDPAGAAERYLPELVSAVHRGLLNGISAIRTSSHLLWTGQVAEAMDILRSLPQDDGAVFTGDTPTADGVRRWLPYLFPGLSAHSAPSLADPGPLPAQESPSASAWAPQHRAVAVLDTVLRSGFSEQVLDMSEQLLRGTRLDDKTLVPLTIALNALVWGDRLHIAESFCESLLKAAPHDQAPMWHALFAVAKANIHFRRGELFEAERSAQTSLRLVSSEGWGVAIGMPLSVLIRTAVAMGRYEKAAAYLTTPVPAAIQQTLFGAHYLFARGYYHMATGECEAALRAFRATGELVAAWQFDNPTIVPWRSSAAQVHLCMGEQEEANALILEQLSLLRPEQHRARAVTLRAQAATEPRHLAIPLLEEAVDLFTRVGDRLELAQTLADLSHTQRMLHQRDAAEVVADKALKLASACGADPLKAILIPMTNGDVRPAGFSPHSPHPLAALSRAEQRVADLAAQGYTNRQISSMLHITVSTVEQHLTRIYRKLSVNRRSDIGSQLQLVNSGAY
ncbi:AAA family ATPase [Solwaraspora sp. WMMD1047]|nr:LuxR family transcriptional regulator [Solwaraspora sp. WMMD1047]MDG4830619.1 AAA family ATPase [Solwaraspora sp. WMMD1047]